MTDQRQPERKPFHPCPECGKETFYSCGGGKGGCGRSCISCGWREERSPLQGATARAVAEMLHRLASTAGGDVQEENHDEGSDSGPNPCGPGGCCGR